MSTHTPHAIVTLVGIVLMTAAVSAQGEAPGLRPPHAPPSSQMPAVLQKVAFEQRLNEPLPLDLPSGTRMVSR